MDIVKRLIRDMGLWKPQKEGLEVFDRLITSSPIGRGITKKQTLAAILGAEPPISYAVQQPNLFNFNEEINNKIGTDFPSFCFAIATGGGKTKLMGALIAYLYKTKTFKNFFILSKGETVYNKHRKEDFDPASPKYVFKGLTDYPTPRLIDGDNYERSGYPELYSDELTLYLFNIEKIFNERTDVEFHFHRFHENIGDSFSGVLRSKPDLVFLMDESHNIRAEKSLRAINALQPILGLEFTATPKAANVIYAYSLREAIQDGLVKRPVVLTRRDDDSLTEEREDIKLTDGINRHERKKILLETYCLNKDIPVVHPRILVSTQDIAHSEKVKGKLESEGFLKGKYKGKVLLVHSGSEDEQIEQLLNLEKVENPIEIVIHVNKLKEGWDVKTIYTIIPLRASVSTILTEQTIGRGLRLPFGEPVSRAPGLSEQERKDLLELDTLEIISHEKYHQVVEERKKAGEEWAAIQVEEQKTESPPINVEIKPDGNTRCALPIPTVEAKTHTAEEIDLTKIKPKIERLEDVEVKLIGTDLATLEDRDYEVILEECKGSIEHFFVRILIEERDDFDMRDKERLRRFVKAYLDKIQVEGGDKKDVIFKHRGGVAQDILNQIQSQIEATTRTEYTVTKKAVEFRAYWRNFTKENEEKQKDTATEKELTNRLIGGYRKSIFTKNVFQSKGEKWLADILDRDKEVLRWVRPPMGQIPITYKGGNYNPDFVVEDKGSKFYVVEVKREDDVETDEVKAKRSAAIAWCQAMSKATKKTWEYKLIPHGEIKPTTSFRGVISKAVKIE